MELFQDFITDCKVQGKHRETRDCSRETLIKELKHITWVLFYASKEHFRDYQYCHHR